MIILQARSCKTHHHFVSLQKVISRTKHWEWFELVLDRKVFSARFLEDHDTPSGHQ